MKRIISGTVALAFVALGFASVSLYASACPVQSSKYAGSQVSQSKAAQNARVFLGRDGLKGAVILQNSSSELGVDKLELSLQYGDTVKILDKGNPLLCNQLDSTSNRVGPFAVSSASRALFLRAR